MYYELYIDVFFLENFMMDSILLFLIRRILKTGRSYGRIILGAAAGSLLTCLVIAAPVPPVVRLVLYHTIVNSIMLVIGGAGRSAAQFLRAFLLLYACSVILGGIMQVFVPYMRYVSLFYAVAVVSAYLFLKMWKLLTGLNRRAETVVEVTVYLKSGKFKTPALLDTGNRLCDPVTGDPVNIIDPGFAPDLTKCPEKERGFCMIPYRCVGGESVMKIFRATKMCVHMEEDRWIDAPFIGIGEQRLSGGGEYGMILNPAVLSG